MENIIELVTTNGIAVAIIVYFLYKDYKFNDAILNVLGEMREVLSSLKTWHEVENREE